MPQISLDYHGIVGDLVVNHFGASCDYDASTSTYFTAGLRFAGRTASGLAPFAQFLAGGVSCCGVKDKAVAVGAGVDVPVKGPRVNVRVQVDVPVEFYPAGVDADGVAYGAGHTTGVRARFGVSVPLGR